jgi:hypothetical protein
MLAGSVCPYYALVLVSPTLGGRSVSELIRLWVASPSMPQLI